MIPTHQSIKALREVVFLNKEFTWNNGAA